ncbi:hypothetical protein AV521_39895 [Streptomyces sp. IMTB 2501]|nr:hypothetical protein AV521_39895 [Streptomyces sp. IMTB 2501]
MAVVLQAGLPPCRTPGVIALAREDLPDSAQPLLRTVMRDGRRTGPPDHWQDARERFREDVAALPEPARRIEDPEPVPPVRSRALDHLTAMVRSDTEARLRRNAAVLAPCALPARTP